MTDLDLMLRFMLQILAVLAACKVIGWIGQKYLVQAQVTMEMIAGVMLGPSLLGIFAPNIQQFLFPQFIHAGDATSGNSPSMSLLWVIVRIGLVLFMLLIGLEFNGKLISGRIKEAVGVSAAGIIFPFTLGIIVCITLLSHRTELFGPNIAPLNQALYIGAAMSITAFPMLARIIDEAKFFTASYNLL